MTFSPTMLYVVITVFGADTGVSVTTDRFFFPYEVACEKVGKMIAKKHRWKVTQPKESGFSPRAERKIRSVVRWNCIPISGKLVADPRMERQP